MFEKKTKIALTSDEWHLVIKALTEFRNYLISQGRYTDPVDELLIKLCK